MRSNSLLIHRELILKGINTSDIATRRTIVRPLHIWGSWELSGAYICTSLGFKGLRDLRFIDVESASKEL